MWHVAEKGVGEHLSNALKTRSHRADWRIKPPSPTVFVAARANRWIRLVSSRSGNRNSIEKTAHAMGAAKADAGFTAIKPRFLPSPLDSVLKPIQCNWSCAVQ